MQAAFLPLGRYLQTVLFCGNANVRIWTPPHLLAFRFLAMRYDCSRISGLGMTSINRGRATMGYSRVGSSLLCRASRPWTFPGFSDAGSTCSPSFGMLATAVDDLLLVSRDAWRSDRHALRFVVGSVSQHRPGHARHLVRERSRCDIRV
jgi:hypothetical protein